MLAMRLWPASSSLHAWTLTALISAAPPLAVTATGNRYTGTNAFEITGRILLPPTYYGTKLFVETNGITTPLVYYRRELNRTIRAGDIVRITAESESMRCGKASAPCALSIEPLAHADLPEAPQFSIWQLTQRPAAFERVAVRGTLTDTYRDDIDEKFGFAIIEDSGHEMEVAFTLVGDILDKFTSLVGAEVIATGILDQSALGGRTNRSYHFLRMLIGGTADIHVVAPPPKGVFDAPELTHFWPDPPRKIASLLRLRATGQVLAVWRGNRLLLQDKDGRLFKAELSGDAMPSPDDVVEVTGIPETDLFDITLKRASWRPAEPLPLAPSERCAMDIAGLFVTKSGERRICTAMRGKTVVVRGVVKSIAYGETGWPQLILADGKHILKVECGHGETTFSGIDEGAVVEASGVCVIDSEAYSSRPIYPRVRGLFLVARGPADIRVLSRPPWWTPSRLMVVIGLLASAFLGILLWNRSLRRLAEHRGRKIAREEVKRAESELKVSERTRLAVELHDAIAQNLTGVSMEIRAAKRALKEDPDRLGGHLDMAATALDSCRAELRNCIWDLHNHALDEASVEEAIRRTIEPHLGDASLFLNFNVPRAMFTDNTIHAVLRIVRELVINAVWHGHATEIKVDGSIDGVNLRFSVCDNGAGFDPSLAPGMEQGHFGIEGIRERISHLNGEMQIESAPGRGTKATLYILQL